MCSEYLHYSWAILNFDSSLAGNIQDKVLVLGSGSKLKLPVMQSWGQTINTIQQVFPKVDDTTSKQGDTGRIQQARGELAVVASGTIPGCFLFVYLEKIISKGALSNFFSWKRDGWPNKFGNLYNKLCCNYFSDNVFCVCISYQKVCKKNDFHWIPITLTSSKKLYYVKPL